MWYLRYWTGRIGVGGGSKRGSKKWVLGGLNIKFGGSKGGFCSVNRVKTGGGSILAHF